MEKDNYIFLKEEYDKQVEAFKAQLEQKYTQEKGKQDQQKGANELQTEHNFRMAEKSFGVSEKDAKNVKDANEHKANTRKWLIEQEKKQELEKFEKGLDQQMWKDFGGSRLKAKEAAFGPDDPEVKAYHEQLQKQKEQQQALDASRQQQTGASNNINRDQVRQNLSEHFRDKAGRSL